MSAEYRRGYSRGYVAGSRRMWPEYAPPNPPEQNVLELFVAAKDLQDAALSVLAVIIPDEEIFMELKRQSENVDAAFVKISEWLKSGPHSEPPK